ncbi:MAG: hypothetical protein DCF23_02755 [Cyanobium sp.]|nr:MAG: hypothetical protein DCF23_02755 [Cyanobium sp.]
MGRLVRLQQAGAMADQGTHYRLLQVGEHGSSRVLPEAALAQQEKGSLPAFLSLGIAQRQRTLPSQ